MSLRCFDEIPCRIRHDIGDGSAVNSLCVHNVRIQHFVNPQRVGIFNWLGTQHETMQRFCIFTGLNALELHDPTMLVRLGALHDERTLTGDQFGPFGHSLIPIREQFHDNFPAQTMGFSDLSNFKHVRLSHAHHMPRSHLADYE